PATIPIEVPMRRRGSLWFFALILLASLAVQAQVSGRVHIIGLLSPPPGAYVAAFEESLRQLGYVRGPNIVFELRSPGGKAELLAGAVADLLRLNVEVIVTGPNPFIDVAKAATASVPIVMVYGAIQSVEATFHPWPGPEATSRARPGNRRPRSS